jgi:hypothetical protein
MPRNSLSGIFANSGLNATPLPPESPAGYDTLIFGPGGGDPALVYTAILEDMASHGYAVLIMYETLVLEFADGRKDFGIPIDFVWNIWFADDIINLCIRDARALCFTDLQTLAKSIGISQKYT